MESPSFSSGSGVTPLIYSTLPGLLNQRFAEIPDKPAHIFRYPITERGCENPASGRTVLTFGDLSARSLTLAGSLLDVGLEKGDRVALMGNNCPEWLYLEYACLRIGVLLIKVPSTFTSASEICDILQYTHSKILIVDPEVTLKVFAAAFPDILLHSHCLCDYKLGFLEKILLLRNSEEVDNYNLTTVTDLVKSNPTADTLNRVKQIEKSLNPDDLAFAFQTSGSTGRSKSVLYSHYGIINCVSQYTYTCCAFDKSEENNVIFSDRPFAWAGSLFVNPIIYGKTNIHVDPVLSVKGKVIDFIFKVLEEEKVTSGIMMPYLLFDVMKGIKSKTITIPSTLKNIWITGERISKEMVDFAQGHFETIRIMYGSTEFFPIAVSKPDKSTQASLDPNWFELCSDLELKLTNNEGGIVPTGVTGNAHIRSPYAMLGYTNDCLTTFGKTSSGWIDLGDSAIMRDNGSFDIIGRTKEIISRGTVKIYPQSVENILYQHEKLDKVKVIGVPDPRLFQEVCACVVPKSGLTITEQELTNFFNAHVQANALSYLPRYYLILESLPIGNTGKIDSKMLEILAIEHFKLGQ